MWNQDTYTQTLLFAAQAHCTQKVPSSDMNYVTHITNVTMEVANALVQSTSHSLDATFAIQCALLHDTIEDTTVVYEDIEKAFGKRVADGVLALTKNEKLPTKEAQMKDSLSRILQQEDEIRVVKIADRINNMQSPPKHWNLAKKKRYHKEAQLILKELGGVNIYIENRLAEKIKEYPQFF